LAEFARVEGVRLILGIGKGNTDRIKQLTDKLERKLNLISTSNNTEIADVIAFLKSDLSMPLPLMLFSPKSQRSSEEHKKVLEQSRFLRDQDYFLVNQGIRVSEYAESIRAA